MNKALELADIPKGTTVAIYGRGGLGGKVVDLLGEHRPDVTVRCYLDSFTTDLTGSVPCWKFSDFPSEEAGVVDMVIIASTFKYEILSHIASHGDRFGIPVRFVHPEFPFGLDATGYSQSLLKSWQVRKRVPSVLAVTFSEACNFRCTMCMAAERGMLQRHFMDQATFSRVIEEYHKVGLNKIGLNGHGESLLHKEFFSMTRQAHEAGLAMSLITNGSLLDEDKINELGGYGVHIAMSFSGWNKESYESQYVGGNFEHASRLIRYMAENLPPEAFTIKSCLLDGDPAVAERVETFFADCGLDLMSFRITEASSQGGALELGHSCQTLDVRSFKPGVDLKRQPLCKRLLNSWMVLPDGRVTACGCGPAIQEFIIGNINEESLEAMGQNPFMDRIIHSFMDEKSRSLGACARCDKPYHPSFMQPMVDMKC